MIRSKRKTKVKQNSLKAIDPNTGWRLYYPNRETTLYYVEFNDHGTLYYKVGITTQSVSKRFSGERVPYRVLGTKKYKSGRTAYIKEQDILKKYSTHRCRYTYILKSGNTELFDTNILKGASWIS